MESGLSRWNWQTSMQLRRCRWHSTATCRAAAVPYSHHLCRRRRKRIPRLRASSFVLELPLWVESPAELYVVAGDLTSWPKLITSSFLGNASVEWSFKGFEFDAFFLRGFSGLRYIELLATWTEDICLVIGADPSSKITCGFDFILKEVKITSWWSLINVLRAHYILFSVTSESIAGYVPGLRGHTSIDTYREIIGTG